MIEIFCFPQGAWKICKETIFVIFVILNAFYCICRKHILIGFENTKINRECVISDSCKSQIKIEESEIVIKRHPDYSYLPIGNNIAIVRIKNVIMNADGKFK